MRLVQDESGVQGRSCYPRLDQARACSALSLHWEPNTHEAEEDHGELI